MDTLLIQLVCVQSVTTYLTFRSPQIQEYGLNSQLNCCLDNVFQSQHKYLSEVGFSGAAADLGGYERDRLHSGIEGILWQTV